MRTDTIAQSALSVWHLTQTEMNQYYLTILATLKKEKEQFTAVLAPSRGGLDMGVKLSHALGIPMIPLPLSYRDSSTAESQQHYMCMTFLLGLQTQHPNEKCRLLIVDDIFATGKTFYKLQELMDLTGFDYRMAVAIHRLEGFEEQYRGPWIDNMITGVEVIMRPDQWVKFPWEWPYALSQVDIPTAG